MTAGTASRAARLPAVMNKGGGVRPGHCRGSVAPGAGFAAAVALVGCRRGSRNMRDASSPREATSSGKGHSAAEQMSQEADMIVRRPLPGRAAARGADPLNQEGSPVHVSVTGRPPAGRFTAWVVRP